MKRYQQLLVLPVIAALWHVCKQIKVKSNCSINGTTMQQQPVLSLTELEEEVGENRF
jgi:hypothetical protein